MLEKGSAKAVLVVLFWGELIVVLYGATFGSDLQNEIGNLTNLRGAGLHTAVFAVLALTAFLTWERTGAIVVALSLVAVAIETAQIFVPGRDASLTDAAASCLGIAAGWAIIKVYALCVPR